MVITFLCILVFLVGWFIFHQRISRKKKIESLILEVVYAYMYGDTARMDQAEAELKDLGITLVGVERINDDE